MTQAEYNEAFEAGKKSVSEVMEGIAKRHLHGLISTDEAFQEMLRLIPADKRG